MKSPSRILLKLILAVAITGCAAAIESSGINVAIPTPTPIYSCAFVAGYDDLASCQTASKSRCTSAFQSFPGGGIATCYLPPAGYEACLLTPTWDWIYSSAPWCDTGTVDGSGKKIFRQPSRSLIACSSTLCLCLNAIQLSPTCSDTDCGHYTPNPVTYATPAPPCP